MHKSRKIAVFALVTLVSGVLVHEAGFAFTDLALLITWMSGPWGGGVATAFWCFGMVASVPLGSLAPALEGPALTATIMWMPGWVHHCSPTMQSFAVLLLLVWMATFMWNFSRFLIAGKCPWNRFSFVELLSTMRRPALFPRTQSSQ